MLRSCPSLALCVVLLAGRAAAWPQKQQEQPDQRPLPGSLDRLPEDQRPPPGSLDRLPEDQSIAAITDAQLQRFLANDDSVKILTDCFVEPRQCTSKQGINLIKQVRALGIGGRCKTCTSEEQDNLGQMIYNFIQGYQTRYPDQWRRVLPNLGTLITAVPSN